MTLRSRYLAVAAIVLLPFLFRGQIIAARPVQTQPTTASLIAAYGDGVRGTGSNVDLAVFDLDAVRQELARLNPALLPVPDGASADASREIRRRLLTSFALEIAAVGSRRHAAAAERLIEWACQYVRSHSPVNDFDRAWSLAALSALEGAIDSEGLRAHLVHLHGSLAAEEPRVQLAYGIAEEQFNAPSEALPRSLAAIELARARQETRTDAESTRALNRAIEHYRDALKAPAVHAEAALRLGHVYLMLHRYDEALAAWNDVTDGSGDPALVYLARLFRGLAHEGLGREDDARAAYLSAAEISPSAHSANMRLAVLAFRAGHQPESQRIIDRLLKNDDPRRDPWWSYYAADWRFWYARIERVRQLER